MVLLAGGRRCINEIHENLRLTQDFVGGIPLTFVQKNACLHEEIVKAITADVADGNLNTEVTKPALFLGHLKPPFPPKGSLKTFEIALDRYD